MCCNDNERKFWVRLQLENDSDVVSKKRLQLFFNDDDGDMRRFTIEVGRSSSDYPAPPPISLMMMMQLYNHKMKKKRKCAQTNEQDGERRGGNDS